jgi:hypothetical protein
MRITLTNGIGIETVTVDHDLLLQDLQLLIENKLKIPVLRQQCLLNGDLLQGDKTLRQLGVTQDDVILVQVNQSAIQSQAEQARQHIINNPTLRQQFLRVSLIDHSKIHN